MQNDDEIAEPARYSTALERLQDETVAGLKAANGQTDPLRPVIMSYLKRGYELGLSPSELTDFFCVSTPSIVEAAGYTDTSGDSVVSLFDEVHDLLRRGLV
jgi:hypothetical protein